MSALANNKHTPADATTGPITLTLPTSPVAGDEVSVEKVDLSTNTVTITGSIRGVTAQSVVMSLVKETVMLRADGSGSWWPISGHKTKSELDRLYASSVFADLIAKADADTGDVCLLIVSDSTAGAGATWVEQSTPMLAARFPNLTVTHIKWADGSPGSYATTVSTVAGTGTHTLWIYNASVSGQTWQYHFDASRWPTMFAALPVAPDATYFSLGHNDNISAEDGGNTMPQKLKAGLFVEFFRTLFPSSRIVLGSQNPILGNFTHASQNRAAALRALAQSRGYGFVDICKAFTDQAAAGVNLTTLINTYPNVHPISTGAPDGYTVWANRFMAEFPAKPQGRVQAQSPPAFSLLGQNLLPDPTFATYDGTATPTGMRLTNVALSRDVTNFETESGALKITGVASGSTAFVEFDMPLALVKGRTVVAVARVYTPAGQPSSPYTGLVGITTNTTSVSSEAWTQADQYSWRAVVLPIPATATQARIRLSADPSNGTAGNSTVTVDRWGVFFGDQPIDPKPSALTPRTTLTGPDVQIFNTTGTWTKPLGATVTTVIAVGPGGGGGSGALTASGSASSGGAGGGGGAFAMRTFPSSVLGSTETVQVNTGGAGAVGQTTSSTAGITGGSSPGSTTFGSHLKANPGSPGAGGTLSGASTGGTGGAGVTAGSTGANGAAGAAGVASSGSNAGPAGGPAGAGVSVTPAAFAGAAGTAPSGTGYTGGTAGASPGGSGGAPSGGAAGEPIPGPSGGSGASSITGNGGAGAAGGNYGAGGAGGGSALNGNTSGAGGAGSPGLCIIISQ